jgi:dTDP-4-dehydrorhamnose reductase
VTSRLEVAQELIAMLRLTKAVRITQVGSDFFAGEYFAARPESERLVNTKLRLHGLDRMRNWKVALRDYLDHYYGGYLDDAAYVAVEPSV